MLNWIFLSLLWTLQVRDLQAQNTSLPSPKTINRNFQQCTNTAAPRSELDHFCPRLEGVHLEGCCPPLFKEPPLQCRYAVYLSRGQLYLTNSSYTVCQNGQNVSIPCCTVAQRGCYRDPVTLPFKPRLLYRNNTCCFENCPSAAYWRTPPAHPAITPSHELVDTGPICTETVLQECTYGNSESCQPSESCPPPPTPPSPVTPTPTPPMPGPTPPMPTPTPPMPTPQPSPQPSPEPAPTPAPSPPPSVDPDGS